MGQLQEKVIRVLKKRFHDVIDGLETVDSTDRVTGWVASSEFDTLDDPQRQDLVWKLLGQDLTPGELNKLGPIVTLTPAEAEIDLRLDSLDR